MKKLVKLFACLFSFLYCFYPSDAHSSKKSAPNINWHVALPMRILIKKLHASAYGKRAGFLKKLDYTIPTFTKAALDRRQNYESAKAQWEGLYLGVASNLRYTHNDSAKSANSMSKDMFLGYEKMLPHRILVGGEGGFSFLKAKAYAKVNPYSDKHQLVADEGWNAHVKFHVGYVWDNVKAYAVAGMAKTSIAANGPSSWHSPNIPSFGGGIEYALKPNLRLRLGYERNSIAYSSVTKKKSPMPTTPRTAISTYKVEAFSVGAIWHWR